MKKTYRIFTLSPGSTSTKYAVFCDKEIVYKANISHNAEQLKGFREISDQLEFRLDAILSDLSKNGLSLDTIDAYAAYSGGLESMLGGIYPVNDILLQHSREGRKAKHPAILGAQIIRALADKNGCPAYIVNPPDVDEFQDLARVTGFKDIYRESRVHVLNQKEVSIRCATDLGKKYEECNFVVAHIGGGLSVAAHCHGRIIDGNDVLRGDGPMAPNRSGALPASAVVKLCYSGVFTEKEIQERIGKTGGLIDHLGMDDTLEILGRISNGDRYAKLIFEAMAYQLAKSIGAYAVVLGGHVDSVILTGGVSNSEYFTNFVSHLVQWMAPVRIYPGDFEMEALAAGALRALNGEEAEKEYTGIPVWVDFNSYNAQETE